MNAFKLTLNIEEVILHQIQHSQNDSVFDLVNPMAPDLCGSLKIEGVRESFPKSVNQNGVDVLKRKPAATKSSPSEKVLRLCIFTVFIVESLHCKWTIMFLFSDFSRMEK